MIDNACIDQSAIEECPIVLLALHNLKTVWEYLRSDYGPDKIQQCFDSAIDVDENCKNFEDKADGTEDTQDNLRCEHRLGRQVLLVEPNNLEHDHEQSEEPQDDENDC